MSNVLKLGNVLKLVELVSDPGSATNGEMYYNTTSNKIRQYVNGSWQDIANSTVTLTGQVLNENEVIVGNASNLSAAVDTGSVGDIMADSSGGLTIKTGVIVDADVNASAAIARSKLASGTADRVLINNGSGVMSELALTSAQIIVGSAGNAPSAVSVTGDVTISNAGVTAISSGVIIDADINASAAIAHSKMAALTASKVAVTDASGFVSTASFAPAEVLLRDGSVALTGNLNANSNKVTNLATPSASGDAATKGYVDAVAEGLKPKTAARVATIANLNLATDLENGDTLDGITLATGDRVLVKNQTAPEDNGIYIVSASGAASRASDFDSLTPIDEINGAYVPVQEGTVNAGKFFVQSGLVSTLGVDAINFVFFNSSATLSGGDGIDITSNVISVDHDGEGFTFSGAQLALELDGSSLSKSSSGVKVADGGISNTQVAAGAGIAVNKLAALTSNRAITSDGSGFLSASATTSTELGYVSGVTSAIQTQLDGKASAALSNLSSVAINTSLISDANNTDDLGSDANEWKDIYAHRLVHNDASNSNLSVETSGNNGSLVLKAHGSGSLDQQVSKRRLSEGYSSSNFMEEQYVDAITLADASSDANIASLQMAHASFEGLSIDYKIKEASTNKVRIGKLNVVTNGTDISYTDVYNDTSDLGVTFSAAINGANLEIHYTTSSTGNNRVMRCYIQRIRA